MLYNTYSLQHRKKMWLQQKQKEEASIPDPTVPDGHIIMPNEDRINTLQVLQQSMYLYCSTSSPTTKYVSIQYYKKRTILM